MMPVRASGSACGKIAGSLDRVSDSTPSVVLAVPSFPCCLHARKNGPEIRLCQRSRAHSRQPGGYWSQSCCVLNVTCNAFCCNSDPTGAIAPGAGRDGILGSGMVALLDPDCGCISINYDGLALNAHTCSAIDYDGRPGQGSALAVVNSDVGQPCLLVVCRCSYCTSPGMRREDCETLDAHPRRLVA
jgi:hypothetical protein